MPKPCNDFLFPDDPHTEFRPGCSLCEKAATRANYAKLWGEPTPSQENRGATAHPKKPNSVALCSLLGEPTGETELCDTCAGKVELKVYGCPVFGTCTIKKQYPGRGCCDGCTSKQLSNR